MNTIDQLAQKLKALGRPTPQSLKRVLEEHALTVEDLEPLLPAASSVTPYVRKEIIRTDGVEMLVMVWHRECAPHDHGRSWGFVRVVEGTATHTVYKLDSNGVPLVRKKVSKYAGATLFAPQGLIHSMGKADSDRLITLHTYSPPITGMRVYDMRRCISCVVRDGCGAWVAPFPEPKPSGNGLVSNLSGNHSSP